MRKVLAVIILVFSMMSIHAELTKLLEKGNVSYWAEPGAEEGYGREVVAVYYPSQKRLVWYEAGNILGRWVYHYFADIPEDENLYWRREYFHFGPKEFVDIYNGVERYTVLVDPDDDFCTTHKGIECFERR